MSVFKAAIEDLLDAVVTESLQVTIAGGSFLVRSLDGQVPGPDQDVILDALQRLWTSDPQQASQIIGDYAKARARIRSAREQFASELVTTSCDESGVVAFGQDGVRQTPGTVRLLAQLQAEHRQRPQLVRRLLGTTPH